MDAIRTFVVSGASGFVGRRVVSLLRDRYGNATMLALSRGEAAETAKGVHWVRADLTRAAQLQASLAPFLLRPAAWIHAAPLPLITAALPMIEAGQIARVVAIGTTSVFSKAGSPIPAEQRMVDEYRAAETAVARSCTALDVPWTLLRPTLIYDGLHDRNVAFIAACVQRLGFFPLVGRGAGRRQPLHASDLAEACVAVLNAAATGNQSYNLGGGEVLSYREMVERICAWRGRRPRIVVVPPLILQWAITLLRLLPRYRYLTRAMVTRMDQDLVFDYSHASADFGFAPRNFLANELLRE